MTDSPAPFVSVVTPFYNGAEYLRECLDSVLAQTYQNFEYLLIDNHSKDGAPEIAREIAARDPRVRVIQPPSFLPQIDNYNFALSQASARADYIKMVAADDALFPGCLREMVALAAAHPRVTLVSSFRLRGARVDPAVRLDPVRDVLSGRETCRLNLLQGVFAFGSPTTLLYRADVVRARTPFFVPERLHPDTEAAFEILADSDFGFVPQVLTFSRTQAESEMGSRRFFMPEVLDRFLMVSQYGPLYLSPEELHRELGKATRWEYSTLAWEWLAQALSERHADFWQYHRKGFSNIGQDIRPELFAAGLARVLLRGLLSPLDTARNLRRTVKKEVRT
ncbi:MAG TPA: glycosyltransferase family 2 protein [Polyangiales bacterium]